MPVIKIIDDDVEIADNLVEELKGKGFTVSAANETEGAEAALAADKPDLLVLDVMFPENPTGGFDLARLIRETEGIKDLPIILLTAVNQEFPIDFSGDDIDPEWMPVQEFLEKPVNVDVLVEKINKLLA
jgi:DNA-binding response OmpR family regulator